MISIFYITILQKGNDIMRALHDQAMKGVDEARLQIDADRNNVDISKRELQQERVQLEQLKKELEEERENIRQQQEEMAVARRKAEEQARCVSVFFLWGFGNACECNTTLLSLLGDVLLANSIIFFTQKRKRRFAGP